MSFERIVGHAEAVAALRKRLGAKTLPHALLFTGPSGVGKRTLAHETVKALLCEKKTDDACDRCGPCGKAERLVHPDLRLVAPGENGQIGIAEIRELGARMRLKPLESSVQAAILGGAETMGDDAQNAFLKLLEEPPPGVHFILVVSDVARLFPTVISRCQKISFGPLKPEEVLEVLRRLPGFEKADAARLAGRSQGSVETALALKDLDVSRIEDGVFGYLRQARTSEIAPFPDRGKTKREEALLEIDTLAGALRDLYLMKTVPGVSGDKLFFKDRRSELEKILPRISPDELERSIEAAGRSREAVEQSGNPRLVFADLWINCGVRFF